MTLGAQVTADIHRESDMHGDETSVAFISPHSTTPCVHSCQRSFRALSQDHFSNSVVILRKETGVTV